MIGGEACGMAGEAGGNKLRARTKASSILMQADNMSSKQRNMLLTGTSWH